MHSTFVFLSAALVLALAATFFFVRSKIKARRKKIPQICIGAIRVTDRAGRDMLIIRKEDGSFEMHEEKAIRRQCVSG